jgi:pyridoxal phosphate enzyme (YggS family)
LPFLLPQRSVLSALLDRYRTLKSAIQDAAKQAGRQSGSVQLVAVSKTQGADAVEALLRAGHRHFGENRVQEAEDKFAALKPRFPDLRLHLIGPLQTNKVKQAVALFDVIESLDRPKLAEALAEEMRRTGRHLPCLIEVNIGSEEQKAGIDPSGLTEFYGFCKGLGLAIEGLMCIPPQGHEPHVWFRHLRALADPLRLSVLSMGMSEDFPAAIACGATHVRVGTALFGPRQ